MSPMICTLFDSTEVCDCILSRSQLMRAISIFQHSTMLLKLGYFARQSPVGNKGGGNVSVIRKVPVTRYFSMGPHAPVP